jgi:carbon storage regulator CsrA
LKGVAVLLIGRDVNQAIVLPELGVRIVVVGRKNGHLQIGIDAPKHINIVREELLLQRARDNWRSNVRPA